MRKGRASIVHTGRCFLRPRGKRSERPETRECDGGLWVVLPLSHMRIVAVLVPSDPRTAKTGTLTQSTTTREPDSVHHLAPGGGEPETMGGQRTVWSADGCHLPPTISRAQHPPLYLLSLLRQPTKLLNEANSTSRRRLRELALGRVGRTRRSGSRNTRRRALRGPDQTPRHRSSRALNVARIPNTAE